MKLMLTRKEKFILITATIVLMVLHGLGKVI